MKKGDVVFFVTKGVVRSGILISRKDGVALIRYQRGDYQKYYHYKLGQIAVEIEGGTNGRLSKSSNPESDKRCDKKAGKIPKCRVSDSEGQKTSDKLFVGAWRIRNMA